MKIKEDYVLADLDDHVVAVAVGEEAEKFKGIIRMNETAAFIWKKLDQGMKAEEIAQKMVEEFSGVDYETALSSTNDVINKMEKAGLFLNE